MPRHKHVTTCLRGGGPVSKHCTCSHCALTVCAVCGAWEASLTTDCPGGSVDPARQDEVAETNLDYTDARGWHLATLPRVMAYDRVVKLRVPRFEEDVIAPEPPRVDPRMAIDSTINWVAIDQAAALQQELALKAIAWVQADRICEDKSAELARAQDDLADTTTIEVDFKKADQEAQRCDDEFRQAARKLVEILNQVTREKTARCRLP